MGKTRRRGGGIGDYFTLAYANPLNWGKSPDAIKAEKCAKATTAYDAAKTKKDEVCPGEASAADLPAETVVTDTTPPAAPTTTTGARRRRRQTRRKYKGGKHRKGH
jgi:hypothetical protein